MKNKEILITQFNNELATLIKMRIESYHLNHISKVDLINELIVCPFHGEWENNDIRIPANAINHFIQNLNIDFVQFNHVHISIKPNMTLSYQLIFSPYFTIQDEEEDFDEDDVYIDYCDGEIEFHHPDEYIGMLSKLSEEVLKMHIKTIQGEISFGTLKSGASI